MTDRRYQSRWSAVRATAQSARGLTLPLAFAGLLWTGGCRTPVGVHGGVVSDGVYVPPPPVEPLRGMSVPSPSSCTAACAAPRWTAPASAPPSIADVCRVPSADVPLVPPQAVEAAPPTTEPPPPAAAAPVLLESRLNELERRSGERAAALEELQSHCLRQADELTRVRVLLDASRTEVQSLTGLVADQQQRDLKSLDELTESLDALLEDSAEADADHFPEQD